MTAMKQTLKVRACGAALFFACVLAAYTFQTTPPPELTIEKVHDDLYMIVGDGGNVAVYITNEGLILVDDKYDQDHAQIMARIRSVTTQPVRYILSTHYHADHSGGNTQFTKEAEIISTRNAHDGIVKHLQSNAPDNMVPARVTFTDETSLFLGGKEVRARYFGRAHTNGDAFVYFPAHRLVHSGDTFASAPTATPLIDYPGGASLIEWTGTLDAVMKAWDFDQVIPGHGPLSNKAGMKAYRDRVEVLRSKAQSLVRSGKSQADLAKFMETEYKWAPDSLFQKWSVPGMMTELK
uniref:Beta-lactamase domain protein n=1 Tax=Solibacter usitatus (strain Ellin6076) TaxID=234267 RepID=Q01YY0_SOLUE